MNMTPHPSRWPRRTGRDTRRAPRDFDIHWPFSDRYMIAALTAAPADAVDAALLSPALAGKHDALTRAGASEAVPNWRRTAATAAVLCALLAWLAAPPAAALIVSGPSAVLAVAIAAALLGSAVIAGAALRHHPRLAYTRSERRHLAAARVQWPTTRADLTRYPNAAALLDDWDRRFEGHIGAPPAAGAAALVWPEPNLVAVAAVIANDIRTTTAWTSAQIDTHRARIDVAATLCQITLVAYRRWREYATNTTNAGAAERTWHELVDLIDSLSDYCTALREIDGLFASKALLDLDAVDDAGIMVELGIDLQTGHFDRDEIRADLDTQIHIAFDRLIGARQ